MLRFLVLQPIIFAIAAFAPALTSASLSRAISSRPEILGRSQPRLAREWLVQTGEKNSRGSDPKDLNEYCKGSDDPSFAEEQHVMADWKGFGNYYPGIIEDKHSDGTVDILYDDGWLEERVKEQDLKPVAQERKERKQRDDAVCELAEDVSKVKDKVKDAEKNVAVYLAGQRAAATDTMAIPDYVASAPAPAVAEAIAPAPAVMSDTHGDQADYLQQLKDELDEVDEAIAQEQAMIDSNDKTIQAAQAAHYGSHTKTVDDLIAEYVARIAERRELLAKLREKRHKQEVQMAGMGQATVSLEEIQSNIEDMNVDMEDIKAKRDKLRKENRLDEELRAAVDSLLRYAGKLQDRIEALVRAQEEADARKKAAEEAEEAAKLAAAEAEAARQAEKKLEKEKEEKDNAEAAKEDEEAAEREAAKNEALAKAAAEKRAAARAAAREAEAELFKAGEDVEEELEIVAKETETLDTGVHPNGDKWWRYRYEHSYVEAGMMIFISVLMLFYTKFLNWLRIEVYERSHMRATSGTMYTRWLEFTSIQMLACLDMFLTIWLLDHVGLFDFTAKHLHGNKLMRLPGRGEQYKRVAFDICVVLIISCLFYFVLMFSIVHWNTVKLRTWAQFDMEEEEDEEFKGAASITSAMQGIHSMTSKHVRRSMTFYGSAEDFQVRKEYFMLQMSMHPIVVRKLLTPRSREGGQSMSTEALLRKFPFFQYLRMNLKTMTDGLLELHWKLWLATIVTFVVLLMLHVFLHVGYIRVMAFFLTLQVATLGTCMYLVYTVNSAIEARMAAEEDDDPDTPRLSRGVTSDANEKMVKAWHVKRIVADLLQYTLFFLCYGAARAICQPWMWKLHFWLVLGVTILTAVLVVIFMLFFAPLLSAFAASMAMPPYIDMENVEKMEKILDSIVDDKISSKVYMQVGTRGHSPS